MTRPIEHWVLTPHALSELARRRIDQDTVAQVLRSPGQRISVRRGRDVIQSLVEFKGKTYVIRVFVDIDRTPPEVVTVYRSSKIEKYWSA